MCPGSAPSIPREGAHEVSCIVLNRKGRSRRTASYRTEKTATGFGGRPRRQPAQQSHPPAFAGPYDVSESSLLAQNDPHDLDQKAKTGSMVVPGRLRSCALSGRQGQRCVMFRTCTQVDMLSTGPAPVVANAAITTAAVHWHAAPRPQPRTPLPARPNQKPAPYSPQA